MFLDEKIYHSLNLEHTADLDALTNADHFVKKHLTNLLKPHNLVLDSEPEKIWIPPDTTFSDFLKLDFVDVLVQDSYFTLLSKAIKGSRKKSFSYRRGY